MSALIRVENLHFTYQYGTANAIPALSGIDLEVGVGEYLAVVGHNGSGKSTLAMHLNGLLLPTRGNVWVDGLNTKDPGKTRAIRSTVGLVFQVPDNQIVATVVEEDVAFGPENLGLPEEEVRQRVDWALRAVGLWEKRQAAPHLLSAGEKQRLALAGVLAMRPKCLVLDEATSLLDPRSREEVMAVIVRLHNEGMTVISITHFMEEAVFADRVVALHQGRVALEGPPREVFSRVEELRRLELDVPPPTALAYGLHSRLPDFPLDLLTVDEVVREVIRYRSW
jgi:energy-coupling factor transporter ATPase